jgi:hypothetical protein
MNKNYARLVVVGQVMEEKYDPAVHTSAGEVYDIIAEIGDKLKFLQNIPWLSDKGVQTAVHLKGMLAVLHKEIEMSIKNSRDTFTPEENGEV